MRIRHPAAVVFRSHSHADNPLNMTMNQSTATSTLLALIFMLRLLHVD